jgi:hypothetical protein
VIGTSQLKEKNEIYLLNFDEEESKIVLEGLFEHPSEMWKISCSPYDANLLATASSSETPGKY